VCYNLCNIVRSAMNQRTSMIASISDYEFQGRTHPPVVKGVLEAMKNGNI
jgi:hypothetical protein